MQLPVALKWLHVLGRSLCKLRHLVSYSAFILIATPRTTPNRGETRRKSFGDTLVRSERAIRGIAIGRKNWLFAGSQDGGHNAAVLSSFIASCKQHEINPQEYLRDVLTRLCRNERVDLEQLLPGTWAPAVL